MGAHVMRPPACRLDRLFTGAHLVVLAWMIGAGVYFVGRDALRAQAPSVEVLGVQVSRMAQDLAQLEDARLDVRVSVLEDAMLEVRWVGRTVAGAVLLQLLAQFRDRRRRS